MIANTRATTPHERFVPQSARVLCVDLDGTLIRSDLLWEAFAVLLRTRPWDLWRVPFWLLSGRVRLKTQLADRAPVDVARLPYHTELVDYLRAERGRGRRVVLATAADPGVARAVADHLGIFDEVVAGDGSVNLKGEAKRAALDARFGSGQYDYVGDHRVDLPVWEGAVEAILVAPGTRLERRARGRARVGRVFEGGRRPVRDWMRQLRVHQWAKNLLIFVPLLAAHQLGNPGLVLASVMAFVAFSFGASAIYIVNDLIDLPSDRVHPVKRNRPLASGVIPIPSAIPVAGALLAAALGIGLMLPAPFTALLVLYLILSLSYSLYLKRKLMKDVICLAGLYTLRVLCGGAATGIVISTWLLVFSLFFFLGLSFLKRYSELRSALGRRGRLPGRAYHGDDYAMIGSLGPACSYLAVLVICLYLNDPASVALYRHPRWLLLICPLLLYWTSRIWILAQRGKMHSDPVVFALKDRQSLATGVLTLAILAAATFL
ncbi:UbiA family prenyltransferase [Tautonia marina]|uniref:UbiA family prenyltransferase n=1 Tax=Tautonia marina TaxID=2653855 RepID=UPI0012606CFE|nr:UbiA family prenyltransferase [Tautonia marina]